MPAALRTQSLASGRASSRYGMVWCNGLLNQENVTNRIPCFHQALGLYTRALAGMLQEAPEALLSEEDWKVGASSRGSPPTTQLPRRLQVSGLSILIFKAGT